MHEHKMTCYLSQEDFGNGFLFKCIAIFAHCCFYSKCRQSATNYDKYFHWPKHLSPPSTDGGGSRLQAILTTLFSKFKKINDRKLVKARICLFGLRY